MSPFITNNGDNALQPLLAVNLSKIGQVEYIQWISFCRQVGYIQWISSIRQKVHIPTNLALSAQCVSMGPVTL